MEFHSISNPIRGCCESAALNMPANLENSAMATGLEKVRFHSHLLKNFPQFVVIHTGKVFGIVNKAEVDVFLELSCFLMIQWMLAI